MAKKIHETRLEELIDENGVQQRTDNPSTPIDGQVWYNQSEGLVKFRVGGLTKSVAFQGESAGQTLYSTTVSSISDLGGAVSAGVADTIYLRVGTYNLTALANPGLVVQKSIRFVGEKQKGATGAKVRIITDSTHFINVAPSSTTVTSNDSVTMTNGSTGVTLTTGVWATTLTGQYLFVEGQAYLIASNPTNTTLTLDRAYTGVTGNKTYFAAAMIDGASFENIEFVAQTTTHDAVVFQNVLRPAVANCTFTSADSIYGKVRYTVTYQPFITGSDFLNYKVNFTSDNYHGVIDQNTFVTSVLMGTDPSVLIDTAKGINPIDTNFSVTNNHHSGPGSFLKFVSASSNTVTENTGNYTSSLWISVDSNSHNNIVLANRPVVATGGDVAIRISSSGNIVNSNRITKPVGIGLDFTATANNNVAIGNRMIGGTINDTVAANRNRIEDDFSRIGQPVSGYQKDFIDVINGILSTLQNVPAALIQQNVAVNSGVVTESPVYWNNTSNEYQLADASNLSRDALVGIVKKTGTNSGNVHLAGLTEFTNSGSVLVNPLFNSGFIGQNFYLGVSGQLIAESVLFTHASGVAANPVLVGRLIDIPGGTRAQLIINTIEDQKYGTPAGQWFIGQSDATEKVITARSTAGDGVSITYAPASRLFYAVYNGLSGEIVQPLNTKIRSNSVFDYDSGVLLQASSSAVIVSPHTAYIGGFKKRTGAAVSVSPISSYSGSTFIFDHRTSGVIVSSGVVTSGVFLGSILNSGSVFVPHTLAPAYTAGAAQASPGAAVAVTSGYIELARAHIPFTGSGTVDFISSASVLASCALDPFYPFQIARIKMQLNGTDVSGTERLVSFAAVSGQVLYHSMSSEKIISVFSQINIMHEVKLMGAYDLPTPTAPVTFSGINLILRGL